MIKAKRVLAITGTPILNRPIELFNILKYLLPTGFPNKFKFAKRYCDAKQTHFGWDFSGASNLEELNRKLRSAIMLRRSKAEVLKDLPAKRRQIIELDLDKGASRVLRAQQRILTGIEAFLGKDTREIDENDYDSIVKSLNSGKNIPFEEMSNARLALAMQKLPLVCDFIENALESEEKIIVFCRHRVLIEELKNHFGEIVVTLTGDSSMDCRQAAVTRFQNDSDIKLFIGNIQAAGVGVTLTAAKLVIFAELDWSPGVVTQAEDRAHRIGTKENILIQHLVVRNSLDALMCRHLIRKQEIIEKLLG